MSDTIKHEKQLNYAGRRKHRHSKKDVAKDKNERKWNY